MLRPRRARVYAGFEQGCSTQSRQCRFDAYGPSEWKSEHSELVGRSCSSDLSFDCGIAKKVYQKDIHLVIFSSNTFSGTVRNSSPASRDSRKGVASLSE